MKRNSEMQAKKPNYGKFNLLLSTDKNPKKSKMKEHLEIPKSMN